MDPAVALAAMRRCRWRRPRRSCRPCRSPRRCACRRCCRITRRYRRRRQASRSPSQYPRPRPRRPRGRRRRGSRNPRGRLRGHMGRPNPLWPHGTSARGRAHSRCNSPFAKPKSPRSLRIHPPPSTPQSPFLLFSCPARCGPALVCFTLGSSRRCRFASRMTIVRGGQGVETDAAPAGKFAQPSSTPSISSPSKSRPTPSINRAEAPSRGRGDGRPKSPGRRTRKPKK